MAAQTQPDARVHIGLASVTRSSRGSLSGPIWLAGDEAGVAFPEVEWPDYPVAVLAAWIPALRRVLTRGETAECHFMDGPYRFTVTATDSQLWRVSCFETREAPSSTNAVIEWRTTPDVFFDSAVAGAKTLLGYCDSRQWWSDDTEQLRAALAFAEPS